MWFLVSKIVTDLSDLPVSLTTLQLPFCMVSWQPDHTLQYCPKFTLDVVCLVLPFNMSCIHHKKVFQVLAIFTSRPRSIWQPDKTDIRGLEYPKYIYIVIIVMWQR